MTEVFEMLKFYGSDLGVNISNGLFEGIPFLNHGMFVQQALQLNGFTFEMALLFLSDLYLTFVSGRSIIGTKTFFG